MFFITGTGRSGTNLLRNMLRMHADIGVMIETHFYPVLYELFGTSPVPFSDFMDVVENHYNSDGAAWIDIIIANEDVDATTFWRIVESEKEVNPSRIISEHVTLLTDAIYGKSKVIGDKTPNSGIYASTLLEIFPDAKFIHVRRDGVFSAISMTTHPGFVKVINGLERAEELDRAHYRGRHAHFPETPVTVEQAADFWTKLAVGLMRGLASVPPERVLEFAYEDLLRDPKPILTRIARFLGVAPDSKWLHDASGTVRPLALKQMSWKLSKEEYERLFDRLGEAAVDYGYQRESYGEYKNFNASGAEWCRYFLDWSLENGKKTVRRILGSGRRKEIAGS